MPIAQEIQRCVEKLPVTQQAEVLDFVRGLSAHQNGAPSDQVEESWADFSLAAAMRDLEDEAGPAYTEADLKQHFA